PRSRGRGDRLAPRRGAPPQGPSAGGLPRDHPCGGEGGAAGSPADRPRPGLRPGGAAGHRPPRRLSAQPLPLEEGAHRAERGPGVPPFEVAKVTARESNRSAPNPYTTSTMQQDASTRLRMAPKKSMQIAQDLYEGVELGSEGPVGLITYMRTDSTRISDTAR